MMNDPIWQWPATAIAGTVKENVDCAGHANTMGVQLVASRFREVGIVARRLRERIDGAGR